MKGFRGRFEIWRRHKSRSRGGQGCSRELGDLQKTIYKKPCLDWAALQITNVMMLGMYVHANDAVTVKSRSQPSKRNSATQKAE